MAMVGSSFTRVRQDDLNLYKHSEGVPLYSLRTNANCIRFRIREQVKKDVEAEYYLVHKTEAS